MKRFLSLILFLVLVVSLVACGQTDGSASMDTANLSENTEQNHVSGKPDGSSKEEGGAFPNLVLAIDQIQERAVIYDLDLYEEGDSLDNLEEWSMPIGHAAGIKYREDTVFGDVIIVGGSKSGIYEYPSKKEIWSTGNPGTNTHSVELLPSGNIVFANSTGSSLRMFYTSALLEDDTKTANQFVDYELEGAHGILWDPEYDVLWGLGGYELVAYSVIGEGTSQKLSQIQGMGANIKKLGYGHDLQPDYTDSQYLYFTAGGAYRFDKESNKTSKAKTEFQQVEIKGFSNNPDDRFFSTGELGGEGKFFEKSHKEEWLTDTILFFTKEEKKGRVIVNKTEIVSSKSAFYKVRSFCGRYQ